MKNRKIWHPILLSPLFLSLVLSSCNMITADSPFAPFVNVGDLPVKYVIASGDPYLMLECLKNQAVLIEDTNLSASEKGEIALDMIDLLAVLSKSISNLLPYLSGNLSPDLLIELEDFYSTSYGRYLIEIQARDLMGYGKFSEPSPLQYFWAILAFTIYQSTENGVVNYVGMNEDDALVYDSYIVAAEQQAADGRNIDYLPPLNHLRTLFGETVVP